MAFINYTKDGNKRNLDIPANGGGSRRDNIGRAYMNSSFIENVYVDQSGTRLYLQTLSLIVSGLPNNLAYPWTLFYDRELASGTTNANEPIGYTFEPGSIIQFTIQCDPYLSYSVSIQMFSSYELTYPSFPEFMITQRQNSNGTWMIALTYNKGTNNKDVLPFSYNGQQEFIFDFTTVS